MTDRPRQPGGSRQPGGPRKPLPRRDRAEIEAHLRHRDRGAIDAHLRNRDRNAAARERLNGSDRPSVYEPRAGSQRRRRKRTSGRRTAIVLATLASILLIAVVVVPPLAGHVFRALAEANSDLIRIGIIADAVGEVMDGRPDEPAGTDPTPVEFVIELGTSSNAITDDLVARDLVTDRLAFTYVLVTEGGLNELQAGVHVLNRTMSPRAVAAELQAPPFPNGTGVPVALRDGLRLEQIVAYLQTLPLDDLDIEEFYDLATAPPDALRADFEWLGVIPEGRSLEGFLGAGIFDVESDIDARGMIEVLLQRWADSPSYQLIAEAEAAGHDFYERVILASIAEREAILDEEKPQIAGVYQNRVDGLDGVRVLNAEPVLIYAKDMIQLRERHISEWPLYVFWTLDGLGRAADFEVPPDLAGYQVWRSRGLPPGPICTPGLASLEAAMNPDTDDGYLYFLAKGDGTNAHVFARTYEEHLANIDFYYGDAATPEPELPTAVPASDEPVLPTAVPLS